MPDFGAFAALSVRCRGDLRSPAQNHVIPMSYYGEIDKNSVWQGRATKGRPYSRLMCRRYSPGIGNIIRAVCAGR